MHSIKFPSGYGSNFARLVSIKELKLNFSMMTVARLVRLDGVRTLGKRSMNPEQKTYDQAHLLVLEYMEVVEPYVLEHKWLLVQQNPERGEGWVAKRHIKEFNN